VIIWLHVDDGFEVASNNHATSDWSQDGYGKEIGNQMVEKPLETCWH
jgi:hypothetical protein